MSKRQLQFVGLAFVAALCTLGTGSAFAGNGTKSIVWSLVSDTNVLGDGDDYSGIYVPGKSLKKTTFEGITELSTDYYVEAGDCGGGSPRFQIGLDTDDDGDFDGNVFVYIGPPPSFTGCPLQTWESTGNLVESTDLRFDTSQVGGTFYSTHAAAVALVGVAKVMDVSLVVDGAWAVAGQRQEIWVDDASVNHHRLTVGFGAATKIKP